MEKNIICYFSGTGNTYWAAKEIANHLGDCEILSIAEYNYNKKLAAKRVGIFFPVYYWGIPNIIRKFATNAQIETEYVYELHTMGGYDGIVANQLKECLKANHNPMELAASYRIKMPNNIALISKSNALTDVYRIPDERHINKFFEKAEKSLTHYADLILHLQENHYTDPIYTRPWKGYGYKLNQTKCASFPQKGEQFSSSLGNSCIGCGKCSQVCPMHNISIESGKPLWGKNCEFCLACLHACPVKAINIGFSEGKERYQCPR